MKTLICFLVIITAGMMSSTRGAPNFSLISEDNTGTTIVNASPDVGVIAAEVTVTLIDTQENYADKKLEQVAVETMVLPLKANMKKAEITSVMEMKDGYILKPPIMTVLLTSNSATTNACTIAYKNEVEQISTGEYVASTSTNLSSTHDVALIPGRSFLPECTVCSISFSNDASNLGYIIASTENTVITAGPKNAEIFTLT